MKKETIEEAAERLYPNDGQFEEFYGNINEFSQKVFLQGAEWQAERMYSKEEVDYLISLLMQTTEYEVSQIFRDKLKQFKKK